MNGIPGRQTARQRQGRWAEDRAQQYLRRQGLRPVDRNFHSRGGEIDLIMRDGRTLVFVEVRYRRDAAFGGALASVDPRKQRKLRAAARAYIQRHPGCAQEPMRFDIVGIEGDGAEPQWLQDAL